MIKEKSKIEDVINFWEQNPLWTGESKFQPNEKEFYNEHNKVYQNDVFAGEINSQIFTSIKDINNEILDLGCGAGFWLSQFASRNFSRLHGADITKNALKISKKRLEYENFDATLSIQNAEKTTFDNEFFDHVNCQGVIHHTPNPSNCIKEIARILKPNGTAVISVYYKNFLLHNWRYISWLGKILYRLEGGLLGRGREKIFLEKDPNEIVRLYDGEDNPIGKAYSKKEFFGMLKPYFNIKNSFLHFFPARSLPINIPKKIHRFLNNHLGFMIIYILKKK